MILGVYSDMARATIRTIRTYPVPTDSLLPKLAAGCNQHLSTLVTYCPFYYWTRVDPRYPYCHILSILSSSKQSPPGGQFGPLLVISLLFNRTVAVCQSTNRLKKRHLWVSFDKTCWSNFHVCSYLLVKQQVLLILVAYYPGYLPHVRGKVSLQVF